MLKRYKFVALLVCLCVFSCGIVGIFGGGSAWATTNVTFRATAGSEEGESVNCSEKFLAALKAATGANGDTVTIDVEGITGLAFTNTGLANTGGTEFSKATDDATKTAVTQIDDLKGIEKFTALTTLDVSGCTALTTLDVSSLTNLTNLTYSDSTSITGTFPTIYAKQVILDGSINMAFYVKGAELSQMQAGSAKFTVSGKTNNGQFCGESYTETDKTDNNTKYYAFSGDITSVQMADPITAAITVGEKTVTFTGYTVKDYLGTITSGSYNDNEKALANALKAYGYYAQQTLSETNDKYGSHESMDAPTGDYAVTADAEAKTTYTTNHAMKILDSDGTEAVTTDVPSVSYTLDLDSKTTLHVYLPGGSTLRDANGKTGINTISSQSSTYTIDSTKVKFTEGTANTTSADIAFSDIAAHELADKFTIPVTIGSTGYTIQISAMSYVDSVISKSNEQLNTAAKLGDSGTYTKAEHLKQAVLALNKYYKTACTYKGLTPIDDPATTETNPD